MYKVFFNDRVVFLGTSFKKSLIQKELFFPVENKGDIKKVWDMFLNDPKNRNLFLVSENIEELKHNFFSHFKLVEAAGGIVLNNKSELLCIYRWGKWDLPKGKIEKGEAKEIAALREVEEECGIRQLILVGEKTTTYHIYPSPKNASIFILKPTYWYSMKYEGDEKPSPQTAEDITNAQWLNGEQLLNAKGSTYASLKDLFEID